VVAFSHEKHVLGHALRYSTASALDDIPQLPLANSVSCNRRNSGRLKSFRDAAIGRAHHAQAHWLSLDERALLPCNGVAEKVMN